MLLHVAIAIVVLSAPVLTYSVILTLTSYFYESTTQFVVIIESINFIDPSIFSLSLIYPIFVFP